MSSLGLTACSAGNATGTAMCTINVQNAHQRHSNMIVMNAKATMKCTAVVTDASGTIKMQRKTIKNKKVVWVDVVNTKHTTPLKTLAANKAKQFNTNDVPCKNGTYRAAAYGSGKLDGVPSGSAAWKYGNPAAIVCK